MKNKYKSYGNKTILYCEKDLTIFEVIIDSEDLIKVAKIKNKWRIIILDGKIYIKAIIETSSGSKTVLLSKYIFELEDNKQILFINKNRLDYRKSNLQVKKSFNSNKYELKKNNIVELILTDYNENEKSRAIIDISDLEKIINYKYKWRYTVIKGNPCIYSNDEYGEKVYIEQFILGTTNYVQHLNKNSLDNRKENLNIKKKINIKKKNTDVLKNIIIKDDSNYIYSIDNDFKFDF